MSRFNSSPQNSAPTQRVDIISGQQSCIRVDGGSNGATVRNDGAVSVDNALAVAQDTNYATVTTVAAGATQTVGANTQRDFWARGSGRVRLLITRP